MSFEKDYFGSLRYGQREQLVKRHVSEVLEWASQTSEVSLCDGRGKTSLDVGCAYGLGIEVLHSLGYSRCGTVILEHSLLMARKIDPSVHVVDKPFETIVGHFDETHISLRTAWEWELATRENITDAGIKVETFIGANLGARNKLLFFRSFRMPYLGLDTRILIRRHG